MTKSIRPLPGHPDKSRRPLDIPTLRQRLAKGALSFDGVNDGLNLANLAGLSAGNTPHTIAAWVRIDSMPQTRAWLLLLGNEGTGAHHWLLNANGVSQLGSWSGNQAGSKPDISAYLVEIKRGGKIKKVLIDAASGTFGVFVELPNPKYEIPAGIKCRADFK